MHTFNYKAILLFNIWFISMILFKCSPTEINSIPNDPKISQTLGLPNFKKVTKDLYRGAQPTKPGFAKLEKMGIKTVVNLRTFHSDRDFLKGTTLQYEQIYMKAWHGEKEDVLRFLSIILDKKKIPVFVHCQHGADRTGLIVAMYRIVIQGWGKEKAIKEMTDGDHGYHDIWSNLIGFIQEIDIKALKIEVGLK